MRLNGKVVLIAGGSGALGQIVTPTFAKSAAQVMTALHRRLRSSEYPR